MIEHKAIEKSDFTTEPHIKYGQYASYFDNSEMAEGYFSGFEEFKNYTPIMLAVSSK
jgi:hypothetical protein